MHELRKARDEIIIEQVKAMKIRQPKVGGKKIHRMLLNLSMPELQVGRDYLFRLLQERKMLVKMKRRYVRTTDTDHQLRIYPNLMADRVINKPNQAWVVDITYIRTYEGFAYLFLVTDYYSRKILSHIVSDTLHADGANQALIKAIRLAAPPAGLIHHSDHGSQYCSKAYQKLLAQNNMQASMTGPNHCYDNAVAERVNGILKQEFGLGKLLPNHAVARQAVADAIRIYNCERLHLSLNYRTPESVYAA